MSTECVHPRAEMEKEAGTGTAEQSVTVVSGDQGDSTCAARGADGAEMPPALSGPPTGELGWQDAMG